MIRQFIIAGFGGQGILLMGQLIAHAGMVTGRNVSWMPAYGAEMRGGSCNCAVVVSDDPVGSPKVEEADALIAMNRLSMDLFEKNVKPGGMVLYNGSLIDAAPKRADIKAYKIPCNEIANNLGNGRAANMVMLGALIALDPLYPAETLVESLREKLGPSREALIPVNRLALLEGMEAAKALSSGV